MEWVSKYGVTTCRKGPIEIVIDWQCDAKGVYGYQVRVNGWKITKSFPDLDSAKVAAIQVQRDQLEEAISNLQEVE